MGTSVTPGGDELVLIIDFGAQYSQLIARRVREHHVYCELVPHHIPLEELLARRPKAVILSGDSDLIPAINLAKEEGVIVRLVHGPEGCPRARCHQDLWDAADERRELGLEVLERLVLRA